jgi:hypothetical protein
MSDDKRKLRGRAPLTVVRGASGVSQHVYYSQVLDPREVHVDDLDRLVEERFLEWVVPDGVGWKLAEDTATGRAGDVVTVSSAEMTNPDDEPGRDPGLVNTVARRPGRDADRDGEPKQDTVRRPGRPSNAEKAAAAEKAELVDAAVKAGMDRGEAEKASVADLRAALKQEKA